MSKIDRFFGEFIVGSFVIGSCALFILIFYHFLTPSYYICGQDGWCKYYVENKITKEKKNIVYFLADEVSWKCVSFQSLSNERTYWRLNLYFPDGKIPATRNGLNSHYESKSGCEAGASHFFEMINVPDTRFHLP